MADEKKEPWLNYLALATVILAVCATLSTFKGGSYSTRSVLSQSQAANQWAYYQAKSLKGYLYEIRKEDLDFDLQENEATLSESGLGHLKDRIAAYAKRMGKYDSEKAEIMKEARNSRKSGTMRRSMPAFSGSPSSSCRSPSCCLRSPRC